MREIITVLTLALLVQNHATAQIGVNFQVNGPENGVSCDGSINMTIDGVGNVNSLYPYMWPSQSGTTFSVSSNGVFDDEICEDEEYMEYSAANCELINDSCVSFVFIGVGPGQDLPGLVSLPAGLELGLGLNMQLPSSINSSDGSITLLDTGNYGLDARYFKTLDMETMLYFWQFGHPTGPMPAIQVGSGLEVTGLDTGLYAIEVNMGDTLYPTFVIEMLPMGSSNCETEMLVSPQVWPALTDQSCDGAVSVHTLGTTGTTSITHTPQNVVGEHVNSLCSGLYTATVSDSSGSVSVPYIIPTEFGIINSSNIPFDPSWDTLYAAATMNCDLDFTQPIDSAVITDVLDLDSVTTLVEWAFYQNGADFIVTQEHYFNIESMSVVTAAVYCENGRADLGYFFAVYPYDFGELSGLDRVVPNIDLQAEPNPSDGLFRLSMPGQKGKQVLLEVFNMNGQQIISSMLPNANNMTIDMRSQPSGIYTCRVLVDNAVARPVRLVVR